MRHNVNDRFVLAAGRSRGEQCPLSASGLHRIGTSRFETALRWRFCLTSLDSQEATGIYIVHVSDLFLPIKFVILNYT